MATIIQNGRVFIGADGDKPHRFVNAIVIDKATGKMIHVGDDTDAAVMQAKAAPGADLHDVQGQVVLPGFVDGHMHLRQTGESLQKLNLRRCKNLAAIQEKIHSYAVAHPELPQISCRGWHHPSTDGHELATQIDGLDMSGKDRPIYIDADDMHSAWLNTAALKEIGADDLADPPGGEICRDKTTGKPTGIFSETATVQIVWPFLSSRLSDKERMQQIQIAFDAYITAGYTGAIELAMNEEDWTTLLQYRETRGEMPLWLAAHWLVLPRDTAEETMKQVDRAIALHRQYNAETSPRLRIAGIKVICDGVVDACTAALQEPYSHTGDNAKAMWTPETLGPVLRAADAAGLQCALHAIGDAAIKLALDALESIEREAGGDSSRGRSQRRHRIEHLEMCAPEDVPRLGRLGVTASVQPVHSDPAGLTAWEKLLGSSRCGHVFPYGALASEGASLALGTDSPTAPLEPLPNLYVATTRRSAMEPERTERTTPQYALELSAAVTAATQGAARSCFAETRVGRLEVGMAADLAVVDMEWNADRLLEAKVTETWIAGKRVYTAEVKKR